MAENERYVIEGPVPSDAELVALLNGVTPRGGCDHKWMWRGGRGIQPMAADRMNGVAEAFNCGLCGEEVVVERRPSVVRGL